MRELPRGEVWRFAGQGLLSGKSCNWLYTHYEDPKDLMQTFHLINSASKVKWEDTVS